jgi:peptidoglycan/xylan/chitin deacetylase (PgdA/CDA1 family)
MHSKRLRKIKFTIAVIVAITTVVLIGGILILKNNYYWNQKFFHLQSEYVKVKIDYAKKTGNFKNLFLADSSKKISDSKSAVSVPVLLYHGVITDPNWKPDGVNISFSDFESQMFALKEAGYNSISLSDFEDFIQGKKSLPEKSILITFDDGRSDSYFNGDPVLRAMNFKAVMFVITGSSFAPGYEKGNFYLTQAELQKMKESGRWELESHTKNSHGFGKIDGNGNQGHYLSNELWVNDQNRTETGAEYSQRVKNDLLASKEDLKNKLKVTSTAFAYPFGDYGQETQNFPDAESLLRKTVEELFPISFRQWDESEFPANYPGANFKLAKRIDVNSGVSTERLIGILNDSQEKTIPYDDSFALNYGWITGWGKSELQNGLFLTGASETEDSSLTFLNGTFTWIDYSIFSQVSIIKGNSFSVVAHYLDDSNYASCDFSNTGMTLTGRVKGTEQTIKESDANFIFSPGTDLTVGMAIKGNQAFCSLNGKIIVSGTLPQNLSHGGIGFKTWDSSSNNSSILVSNLKIN